MQDYVLYEVKNRIGIITLNKPEKRNALNFDFVNEIKEKIRFADADENCKVIVIKSSGEAFSSGADLASLQKMQANTIEQNLEDSNNLKELFHLIYTSKKIVISQVDGPALAGGCGLATICDFVFASTNSKFGYTEVKIGFVPAIVMIFLIRKIGEQNARRLLLTGDIISSERAKEINLIDFVVDKTQLEEEVFSFAQKLCTSTSAQSIQVTKQMINEVQNKSLDEALDYASSMNSQARMTKDCVKGINAFLNKEKISW